MTERGLPSPSDASPSGASGKGKSKGKLTPFFLFSSEAREGVRLELTVGGHPPAGVNVAKVLGERWQALDPDVKAVYKERCEALQAAQAEDEGDEDYDGEGEDPLEKEKELPQSRIKRLIRLDDEVKNVSNEAVRLIAKATELFLECMVEEAEAYRSQSTTKRKSLTFMDVEQSISTSMRMAPWLSQHLFASRPPRKQPRASPLPPTPAPAPSSSSLAASGELFSPALYTPAPESGATYGGGLGNMLGMGNTPAAVLGNHPPA